MRGGLYDDCYPGRSPYPLPSQSEARSNSHACTEQAMTSHKKMSMVRFLGDALGAVPAFMCQS